MMIPVVPSDLLEACVLCWKCVTLHTHHTHVHMHTHSHSLTHTHTHTHTPPMKVTVEILSVFRIDSNNFHGWEIAVILRNFRKTKLSKSKFLFFFSFFYSISTMYTMCDSTTFALRHTQISLSGILRHFARQAATFFYTHMIQTTSRKRGFSQKWKSKIAEKNFFHSKQIHKHTLFFKQSVRVVESMEITRERMRVYQQNRALMELSFVDICIFQAISMTEVYGRSWLVKKVC